VFDYMRVYNMQPFYGFKMSSANYYCHFLEELGFVVVVGGVETNRFKIISIHLSLCTYLCQPNNQVDAIS